MGCFFVSLLINMYLCTVFCACATIFYFLDVLKQDERNYEKYSVA